MRAQSSIIAVALALVVVGRPTSPAAQAPQTPTFRSEVAVTTLDVTVIDGSGRQIPDLKASDFTVRVDGRPRAVVRVEWVPLARPTTSLPVVPQPEGYSTNEGSTGGRLILIAVDQPNIRSGGAMAIRSTFEAFLDRLDPSDRIAVVALGGGVSTPFTTNRATVKDAIGKTNGEMRPIADMGVHSLTATEALDIANGGQGSLQTVVNRECQPGDRNCPSEILTDAAVISASLRQEADRALQGLRGLLDSLKKIEAPKTLVLISEGFVGDVTDSVAALAPLAASARTSIHALKLDDRAFEVENRRQPPRGVGDRLVRLAGLDALTALARGSVYEVVGTGSAALGRLEQEISGYYLLGVESTPADADGKAHPINVRVARSGAVVRARRDLADAAIRTASGALSPTEAVATALGSPLLVTDLPMHVATFSLRDEDPAKIQVLIHVDIGKAYTSAQAISLGYVISDSAGNVVVHQVGGGRLAPAGNVLGPLGYTVSASLPPGEYTLKFAAAEGGHAGSVEHPVHAGLIDAGAFKMSELLIGGPVDARELLRPSVGYEVQFGGAQGYIEAYGDGQGLLMRYEVAPSLEAPSVVSAVVPGRSGGDGRTVFSYIMPVNDLPPGSYVLRATLSAGSTSNAPIKRVARAFRVLPTVAPPPPPAAPAPAARAVEAPAAAPALSIARAFRREDVVQGDTLQRFKDLVAPPARQDFDAGVAFLQAADYQRAELSFKAAQRASLASGNSTAPLAYLAATYAASGHDLEAANVWQTALIDGSDYSEIYVWLADAFIRIRNYEQARSILKEAIEKWPADTRLTERVGTLPQ